MDGEWTPWSQWRDCSRPCGGGERTRSRFCNPPRHGGEDCVGEDEEKEDCNNHQCPSTLSAGDIVKIVKAGTDIAKDLVGTGLKFYSEVRSVDGTWSSYGAWSSCTVTCGGGKKTRTRTCEGRENGGKQCQGESVLESPCNTQACPTVVFGDVDNSHRG